MKENLGWLCGGQPEIDRNGVALIRPNPRAVSGDREALLVARRDHVFEILSRDGEALVGEAA